MLLLSIVSCDVCAFEVARFDIVENDLELGFAENFVLMCFECDVNVP